MSAVGPVGRPNRLVLAVAVLGTPAAIGLGAPLVAPPPVTQQAMLDETAALARALYDVRRTPVRIDWERRLVGPSEARAAAEAIVRGAFAPGDVEIDEQLFRRLGLLPDGVSYLDLLAGAVAREPTGFYDPATRRLYVPGLTPLPEQRPALAHEVAHALQDQRFGLRRFLKMAPDGRRGLSFDGLLARQALVEGDATVLAMEALDVSATFPSPWELADLAQRTRERAATAFATASDGAQASPTAPPPMLAPPATPGFLAALLAFPYSEGFAFVAATRGLAPWSAVDALWARPPESTAQILHPRKYERREGAPGGELPALPLMGDTLQLARADTLGELMIRVWLSSPGVTPPGPTPPGPTTPGPRPGPAGAAGVPLPPDVAERAATGWRGDRVAIYVPAAPDKTGVVEREARGAVLAWITAWDSDADANDFLQSVSPRLADLASEGAAPAETEAEARPGVWRARGADSVFAAQRRGTLVALLLGAPEAALPSLGTLLDAWTPRKEAAPRRARAGRSAPSTARPPAPR